MRERWIGILVAAGLVMAACGPTTAPAAGGTGTAATGTAAAGTRLVVGLNADVRSLDPLTPLDATTTRVLRNIYDPLFFRDQQNKLIPWLATSGTMDASGVWTIKLRQGVRFTDGEPFDASSVKATLDWILDPAHKALIRSLLDEITSVQVVDPYTVAITTKQPFPGLLGTLTDVFMVPPKVLAQGIDALQKNPVGTGPYRLASWQPNQAIDLVANDDYWRGKPAIHEVVFKIIPEVDARVAALLAGEVDLVPDVPPESVAAVQKGGAAIATVPGREIIYVGFNLLQPGPLQDVRVRQALNEAVNVNGIIKDLLSGYATRMPGPLDPMNADFDPDLQGYAYDPARAQALLAQAGYGSGGQALSLVLNTPKGRYLQDYEAAQEIAQELQQVGVHVTLKTAEWGTYLNTVQSGKVQDLFLLGRSDREFDGTFLRDLFTCGAAWVLYCNQSLSAAVQQAATQVDAAARAAAWRKIQADVVQQAPWIFLWDQHDVYGVAKRVQWQPRADEQIFLFDAQVH
jgi:peptide/nickel transport system substrate-binding protein